MVRHRLTYSQKDQKLKLSTLTGPVSSQLSVVRKQDAELLSLKPVHERIKEIFQLMRKTARPAGNILFFIMYDISSNRVRNLIAKYLKEKLYGTNTMY